MDECVFCRIARGETGAGFVFENDLVVAFDDINPQAAVHTLVIPRDHYEHFGDGVPDDVVAALFSAVTDVAAIKGIDRSGYRVIVNKGPDARQSVAHLHVHVLGGQPMSHGMVVFEHGS